MMEKSLPLDIELYQHSNLPPEEKKRTVRAVLKDTATHKVLRLVQDGASRPLI